MIMEFDKYAEFYDSGFMGKGSQRFYSDLVKALEINDGNSVLDVGCGTGQVLSIIGKQKDVSGFDLDVSEKMIEVAKSKNPEFEFVTGSCDELPYGDESMDVVMACMAYHHFPDQAAFRREVYRVLKPGGSVYICDPRFPAPIRGFFNTFFKDAAFRTTKRNAKDYESDGFKTTGVTKDMYVQVLKFTKQQI